MDKSKIKDLFIGMGIGIVGFILGTALLVLAYTKLNNVSFSFVKENADYILQESPTNMATGTLLLNFIGFYLLMKSKRPLYAQGILLICIIVIIASLCY